MIKTIRILADLEYKYNNKLPNDTIVIGTIPIGKIIPRRGAKKLKKDLEYIYNYINFINDIDKWELFITTGDNNKEYLSLKIKQAKHLEYLPYTTGNIDAIAQSTECACCHCFNRTLPSLIFDYIEKPDFVTGRPTLSGLCPRCSIDSIIPNYYIRYNDELLKKWHKQGWDNNLETKKN